MTSLKGFTPPSIMDIFKKEVNPLEKEFGIDWHQILLKNL